MIRADLDPNHCPRIDYCILCTSCPDLQNFYRHLRVEQAILNPTLTPRRHRVDLVNKQAVNDPENRISERDNVCNEHEDAKNELEAEKEKAGHSVEPRPGVSGKQKVRHASKCDKAAKAKESEPDPQPLVGSEMFCHVYGTSFSAQYMVLAISEPCEPDDSGELYSFKTVYNVWNLATSESWQLAADKALMQPGDLLVHDNLGWKFL